LKVVVEYKIKVAAINGY